jgi:hypothetical protein
MMEGKCQPGICHLTMTSFSWSTDLNLCVLWFGQFLHIALQPRIAIFGTHVDDGGYICHLILISVDIHGMYKAKGQVRHSVVS